MAMTATLQTYLDETRRLVHDPVGLYWTTGDVTANIVSAMQRRDADTGANRTLITKVLTVGQETYTLTQLGNTSVFDVVGIYLLFNGARVLLQERSFTKQSTNARVWTTQRNAPFSMARYGVATFYLSPPPSTAYTTEWDCCVIGTPLVAVTDVDALPYPFTEPVPFWAAHLCLYNMKTYDQAEVMRQKYQDSLRMIEGSRSGLLPSGYPIYGR